MTKSVDFYFDIVSPASYFAWHVLPKIAAVAGAQINYVPMFLGGVMQSTGNRPPGTVEAKRRWMSDDLARWAAFYDLPFQRNSIFPQNTLPVMRGAIAFQDELVLYGNALMQAMHVDNRDIQDPQVIAEAVAPVGIAPDEFVERISEPAIKDALKANTEQAVARGVFGAPTFFVGETMHFGQDRLFMVAEDLGTTLHDALGK